MFGGLYFGQGYLGKAAGATTTTGIFNLPNMGETSTSPVVSLKSTRAVIRYKSTAQVIPDINSTRLVNSNE
jgi:hypothetical protein